MSAPKTLDGKIVLQAYMLDNSYKTLLVEPSSTVHDVCRRRECSCCARLRRPALGLPPARPPHALSPLACARACTHNNPLQWRR